MRSIHNFGIIAKPSILRISPNANTLNGLIPDLFAALDVVSRKLVGFLPVVERSASAERAAVGQPVVWAIAPDQTAQDVVPAMTVPEPRDQVIGSNSMTISKSRKVEFGYTGEEQRGLNTGVGYLSVQAQQIAKAIRTLTNEMETDLANEASANASRAYGTAGITPFTADKLVDTAQLKKILDDNGAPPERALVIDTSAGANLRSMYNLTRVNEAGTAMTLRQGELLDLHGFSVRESAGIGTFVAGTGASGTTNNAGYAIGATIITLASAGTGIVKSGDAVTFAGDTNKYIVASGDTDISNGGAITLSAPGLRVAIPASTTAITVLASHIKNIAFSSDALRLAMRAPALPDEGDAATERMTITDARSGMSFEISVYLGYRKVSMEIAAAWGVKAVKREHIAVLLG